MLNHFSHRTTQRLCFTAFLLPLLVARGASLHATPPEGLVNNVAETPSESEEARTTPRIASDVADAEDQPADLLQRLQEAEKRIAQLENARDTPSTSDGKPEPLPFPEENQLQLDKLWQDYEAKQVSTSPTVEVFGRMHLEALGFPEQTPGIGYFENPATGTKAEDRIQFRRIRLGAEGHLAPSSIYRVEVDLGNPSRSSFRDTYFGFEDMPVLQTLLIGNQKRPLGLDSWNSNQHVLFFERPLIVNAFNPNYRRIGIQSYGHSEGENLNWQMGVFELQDVKNIGSDIGDPLHLSINTRVSGTPWYNEASGGRGYLHLGVSDMYTTTSPDLHLSGNNGEMASFETRPELRTTSSWIDTDAIFGATQYNVTGFESVLNIGSLQVQGEYMTTLVDRDSDSNLHFEGGYVQVAYFLTGEYEPWDREFGRLARPKPNKNFYWVRTSGNRAHQGWGAWQVAARWSYASLTDKDVLGGRQEDVTLGLNWYWTAHSKMMLNLVHGNIYDHAPIGGYTEGTFTGIGARLLMDY